MNISEALIKEIVAKVCANMNEADSVPFERNVLSNGMMSIKNIPPGIRRIKRRMHQRDRRSRHITLQRHAFKELHVIARKLCACPLDSDRCIGVESGSSAILIHRNVIMISTDCGKKIQLLRHCQATLHIGIITDQIAEEQKVIDPDFTAL